MSNEMVVRDSSFLEEKPKKLFTSLNFDTREGKMAIQKAMVKSDFSADDVKDKPFFITDVVIHGVEIITEDGELVEGLRTVLVTDKGETVAFVSEGIINSVKTIFSLFGAPPWSEPLKVAVKESKTRRGWKVLNLLVVD